VYQLPWGSSIYAKIVSYNFFGYSKESAVGNGAVILTYPDPPLNVAEIISERSDSSISLSWTNGLADGGASVLDYRITYDNSIGDYIVLASAIKNPYF